MVIRVYLAGWSTIGHSFGIYIYIFIYWTDQRFVDDNKNRYLFGVRHVCFFRVGRNSCLECRKVPRYSRWKYLIADVSYLNFYV